MCQRYHHQLLLPSHPKDPMLRSQAVRLHLIYRSVLSLNSRAVYRYVHRRPCAQSCWYSKMFPKEFESGRPAWPRRANSRPWPRHVSAARWHPGAAHCVRGHRAMRVAAAARRRPPELARRPLLGPARASAVRRIGASGMRKLADTVRLLKNLCLS